MPLEARLEALATAVGLPETLRTALESGGISEARRLELFMGSGIAHERGGKLLEALRAAEGNEDLPDSPGNKVCVPGVWLLDTRFLPSLYCRPISGCFS